MIGINDGCRLQTKGEGGVMADTGANVCRKQTTDGILNARSIPPVALNLALEEEESIAFKPCVVMGYMPMM